MDFGLTLTNPLLRVAVEAGEATIRQACEAPDDLRIAAGMEQYADGRDAICITVESDGSVAQFTMLLRKYFDRGVLWRVARRAWNHRTAGGRRSRALHFEMADYGVGAN